MVPVAEMTTLLMLKERGVLTPCSSWEKGVWLGVGGEERGKTGRDLDEGKRSGKRRDVGRPVGVCSALLMGEEESRKECPVVNVEGRPSMTVLSSSSSERRGGGAFEMDLVMGTTAAEPGGIADLDLLVEGGGPKASKSETNAKSEGVGTFERGEVDRTLCCCSGC